MIRPLDPSRIVALAFLAWPWLSMEAQAEETEPDDRIYLTVKAGMHDRADPPIRFTIPEERFGPLVRKALDDGPVVLDTKLQVEEPGEVKATRWHAQVERGPAGSRARVTFYLVEPLRKGEVARYWLDVKEPSSKLNPTWTLTESKPGAFDLKNGDRPVFRYNAAPVSSPNYKEIQNRDAYIHPAYSPSGALVTGDFSPSHPHHRGFFLAYEKTRSGDLTPDFWNIHYGTGKIHSEGFDKPVLGLWTARFSARHRWDATEKASGKSVTVLRERWDVEAFAILPARYWLFDVTSTQQAVDRPLEVLPYRYGGMAYRGPEPFVKGALDILTSEGLHRKDGDQKPARWVDLTGPVADSSTQYAGAMIADHPSNPHYPNVARIHPTTLPFFCYVPAHDKPLTIAVDTPTVFRYRVLIHDGHPDPKLDEQVANDFAEPPMVVVE
jgi:Family of unknown function (DUF6807)